MNNQNGSAVSLLRQVVDLLEPGNRGQQSNTVSQQHSNGSQQPGNRGQQPSNAGQQHTNGSQQPGNRSQQPSNVGQQHTNGNQQPGHSSSSTNHSSTAVLEHRRLFNREFNHIQGEEFVDREEGQPKKNYLQKPCFVWPTKTSQRFQQQLKNCHSLKMDLGRNEYPFQHQQQIML